MHGLGGSQCGQFWAARTLAGRGYVALAITAPDGEAEKLAAIRAGIDLLRSPANPFAKLTDRGAIGAAGHSQGANAVAQAQAADGRIDAIVAFDNLRRYAAGDPGVAVGCNGQPRDEIAPRVPAMGQAMDLPCVNRPDDLSPDLKKHGFEHWRAAGLPTMEIVFRGAIHEDWGGGADGGPREAELRRAFSHYLVAWFDRWLEGRKGATDRLLARKVTGGPARRLLSEQFLSGAAFPGARGCAADLRSCLG